MSVNTPFYIEENEELVIDVRDSIPGGGKTIGWPFFAVDTNNFTGLAIHHTAGPKSQSIDDIAWYHINSRKWHSVGYHFLIKDGKAYYVGDLSIGRAHVAGLNDKFIGVCIIGNYQEESPSDADLKVVHLLCREFIENEPNRFKNINDWNNVKPHAVLVPTACPGDTYPQWWNKIVMGVDDSMELKKRIEELEIKVKEEANRGDEWKKKCLDEREDHKNTKKAFEVSKSLAEEWEVKYGGEKALREQMESRVEGLENVFIPSLKDQIIDLESNVLRLKNEEYTIPESVLFLANAIRGRRWNKNNVK